MASDQPFNNALAATSIDFSYGRQQVLTGVSLSVRAAEAVALVGPNGSGKSTLLRVCAGDLRPAAGTVSIGSDPLASLSPRERARRIAVVPQHIEPALAFPVRELVMMGRSPYTGLFGSVAATDRAAVERALQATDTTQLATRAFNELSGGEQQRVALAMALAQETAYLLLDEPTVHLDLQHQFEVLDLLRSLQLERGIGLLAVLHDLNLAGLFFDRVVVLSRGRIAAAGTVNEVLRDREALGVFRAPLTLLDHPEEAVPQVLLGRRW